MDAVTNNSIGLSGDASPVASASGSGGGGDLGSGSVGGESVSTDMMELDSPSMEDQDGRGANSGVHAFCRAETAAALGRALVKGAIAKKKYKQAER